jgi:hypothetical protein
MTELTQKALEMIGIKLMPHNVILSLATKFALPSPLIEHISEVKSLLCSVFVANPRSSSTQNSK